MNAGGPSKFHLFNAEIGDTVVGNGKIALLVYVRVSSGFKPVVSGKGQVNHGINLGVSRFHNKGGVGLAFQCGSTAIAFIATHFASDSGGASWGTHRNMLKGSQREGSRVEWLIQRLEGIACHFWD